MKKIHYLFLLVLIFVACETEEIEKTPAAFDTEEIFSKSSITNIPVLSVAEHRAFLEFNSFVIGQLILWSPADRQLIINSIDPLTRTVSMNLLLNDQINPTFRDHFIYVANYATDRYTRCSNPDNEPWPPLGSPPDFTENSLVYNHPILNEGSRLLIAQLSLYKTELYIPNSMTVGDIYTVGHPLEDVSYSMGLKIYKTPVSYSVLGQSCIRFSTDVYVNDSNVVNNDRIILSRPDLPDNSTYSYINFNVKSYLSPPAVTGSGSTNLHL